MKNVGVFGGAQVHSSRRLQAAREYADAVGAEPESQGFIPCDRRNHVRGRSVVAVSYQNGERSMALRHIQLKFV